MTDYISTGFSLSMIKHKGRAVCTFIPVGISAVPDNAVSIIGHKRAAEIVEEILGRMVAYNRTNIELTDNDTVYAFIRTEGGRNGGWLRSGIGSETTVYQINVKEIEDGNMSRKKTTREAVRQIAEISGMDLQQIDQLYVGYRRIGLTKRCAIKMLELQFIQYKKGLEKLIDWTGYLTCQHDALRGGKTRNGNVVHVKRARERLLVFVYAEPITLEYSFTDSLPEGPCSVEELRNETGLKFMASSKDKE